MHEFHVEATQLVRAPVEKVFSVVTDYESAPKWSKFYTSVRVTNRSDNVTDLEVETHAFGRKEKGPSKAIATPMSRLELQGNHKEFVRDAVLSLEPHSEGTKLTYKSDIQLNGMIATIVGPLEKHRVEELAKDEVKSLAKYIESMK